MCSVKTPKVEQTAEKPLPIIRNPLLDGFDPSGQLRIGKQNLRIDLGSGKPASSAPGYTPPTAAASPVRVPIDASGLKGWDLIRASAATIARGKAAQGRG